MQTEREAAAQAQALLRGAQAVHTQLTSMAADANSGASWVLGAGRKTDLVATLEEILALHGTPDMVRAMVRETVRSHPSVATDSPHVLSVSIGGELIAIKWRKLGGIWVFTSDGVPGLFVAHPDAGEALASVERAVERLREANRPGQHAQPKPAAGQPFKVGDRVRLRSNPKEPPRTVTELTAEGFKWRLDEPVLLHPFLGTMQDGECTAPQLYELAPTDLGAPTQEPLSIALNTQHPDCHRAADAFWGSWKANGETHRKGYYEATWGAINAALRMVGVVRHDYGDKT